MLLSRSLCLSICLSLSFLLGMNNRRRFRTFLLCQYRYDWVIGNPFSYQRETLQPTIVSIKNGSLLFLQGGFITYGHVTWWEMRSNWLDTKMLCHPHTKYTTFCKKKAVCVCACMCWFSGSAVCIFEKRCLTKSGAVDVNGGISIANLWMLIELMVCSITNG